MKSVLRDTISKFLPTTWGLDESHIRGGSICNNSNSMLLSFFFGDFDWSVGKIKLFLHFDKNPCVGIFDNCLDFTVLDCVDNNELYRKLYYFY